MDYPEQKHQRRVRYRGAHPRDLKEKYEELQPEKYTDTIAKTPRKGNIPIGMHISICVKEVLDFLQIRSGQIGLDVTLGYGGHTLEILKCLESKGHLYSLDVDPAELSKTAERLQRSGYDSSLLTTRLLNFTNIDQAAAEAGPLDFVLTDLDLSSMQIDNPDKGLSYKKDGPLDLRLNPEKGISGAERLKEVTQGEIEGMLIESLDEPYAVQISRAIISQMEKGAEISMTTQLQQIIEDALKSTAKDRRKELTRKSCQRTFQALRIDVNSEFEVLYEFLEKLPSVLAKGGRVAILSFHSGEDRLVKESFKVSLREGVYSETSTEAIRPSAEECNRNSRVRSAKSGWAIKA